MLIRLQLKAFYHRAVHDLADELVAFFCTLVLFGLFYYIFSDFFQEKLKALDPAFKNRVLFMGMVATLFGVGLNEGARVAREWQEDDLSGFAFRLGAKRCPVVMARLLGQGLREGVVALLWIWISLQFKLTIDQMALSFLGFLLGLGLGLWRSNREPSFGPKRLRGGRTKLIQMANLRLKQMLFRKQKAMVLWALITLSPFLGLSHGDWPVPLLGIYFFFMGFLATIPLAFQLREDLRSSWLEQLLGISHNQIVGLYGLLGLWVAAPLGGTLLAAVVIFPPVGDWWLWLVASFLAPLLFPTLMFQLDPTRPVLGLLTTFLVGLFLCSAFFIHPGFLILLPLIMGYAAKYQSERYYRA